MKNDIKLAKGYLFLSIGIIIFGIIDFIYQFYTDRKWFVCIIALTLGLLSLIKSIKKLKKKN